MTIQAIQATRGSTSKRTSTKRAAKPPLVPMRIKPASPPKDVIAATHSQLGAAILAARTAAGLSQTELAVRLKTPQPNIARLEKGGSMPSTNTLKRIAKATSHKLVITLTQKDHRQLVDVGSNMNQVSSVMYWYKDGHFKTEDEARGAFMLAYQQGLDGMGKSIRQWMGLTTEQYDAWLRDDSLPPRQR
jgi:transcriptional regulator with XRE-family HTH domain